jgi:hypothetical protein
MERPAACGIGGGRPDVRAAVRDADAARCFRRAAEDQRAVSDDTLTITGGPGGVVSIRSENGALGAPVFPPASVALARNVDVPSGSAVPV